MFCIFFCRFRYGFDHFFPNFCLPRRNLSLNTVPCTEVFGGRDPSTRRLQGWGSSALGSISRDPTKPKATASFFFFFFSPGFCDTSGSFFFFFPHVGSYNPKKQKEPNEMWRKQGLRTNRREEAQTYIPPKRRQKNMALISHQSTNSAPKR